MDTGENHHVTKEVSASLDYHTLPNPIPLHVATESTGNFLTGVGSLLIQSDAGKSMLIKTICYCARAKGTLISVAALVEEGVWFSFHGSYLFFTSGCLTVT